MVTRQSAGLSIEGTVVQSHLPPFRNSGNFVCLTFACVFVRETKSRWSLLFGVYARGSKRSSHTGGKCVTCSGLTNSREVLLRQPKFGQFGENHLRNKRAYRVWSKCSMLLLETSRCWRQVAGLGTSPSGTWLGPINSIVCHCVQAVNQVTHVMLSTSRQSSLTHQSSSLIFTMGPTLCTDQHPTPRGYRQGNTLNASPKYARMSIGAYLVYHSICTENVVDFVVNVQV